MYFKSRLGTALAATIIAACMLLLGGATAARADFITFTLENVTFDDGGSATGTITFDPTGCHCLNALAITTTDGLLAPVLSGGTYGDVKSIDLSDPSQTRFVFLAFEAQPNVLELVVQGNPLSSTTPSPILTSSQEFPALGPGEPFRQVQSPPLLSPAPPPEPW